MKLVRIFLCMKLDSIDRKFFVFDCIDYVITIYIFVVGEKRVVLGYCWVGKPVVLWEAIVMVEVYNFVV